MESENNTNNSTKSANQNTHVFKIDKFFVPKTAHEEFLNQVQKTHKTLKKQEGFIRDNVLELTTGPSEFNFVTIAEWQGQEYIEAAKSKVKAMHAKSNFKPQEMFKQLDIKADIGNYIEADN